MTPMSREAVALNRFGLGARPDGAPPADPKAWLLDQFPAFEARPATMAAARASADLAGEYLAAEAALKEADAAAKMAGNKDLRQRGQKLYQDEVAMRAVAALTAPAPWVERLVHFWSNHFAISTEKAPVLLLAGAFEREAIRPHVLGKFSDMLLAVERHPAMQIFLDQPRSIGPGSPLAQHAANRKLGINENLAREILELHTLGVRTGYTQADVIAFALALTGWSVETPRPRGQLAAPGSFVFRPEMHEPGARKIVGKTYAAGGVEQAEAVLRDLAVADATATHVATKLARHFVGDAPPPAVVDRLAAAFRSSGGDLPMVYRALVDAPEAWASRPAKFKTPWEWTVSAARALGWDDLGPLKPAPMLAQLGQAVWRPGSPAGWDDIAASWAGPDALVRRVQVAQRLAVRSSHLDPRAVAPKVLPGALGPLTAEEVERAESRRTGLALLLVSPEFLRR
jgi:uncharacterized protein (DUF1800 family)